VQFSGRLLADWKARRRPPQELRVAATPQGAERERAALALIERRHASVGAQSLGTAASEADVELVKAQLDAGVSGQRPARQGRSMDLRTYGIGAQILRELGVGRMRLMAAPRKMPSMTGFGLEVTGYVESPRG